MFPLFKESFSKASSGLGKSLLLLTCDFGRSLLASQHRIATMRSSLRRRKMRQIMLKPVSHGDIVIQSQLFNIPLSQHHFCLLFKETPNASDYHTRRPTYMAGHSRQNTTIKARKVW